MGASTKSPWQGGWKAFLGPLVDAVAFIVALRAGWHYGLAHIGSFALATAVAAGLDRRMFLAPGAAGGPMARGTTFLAVTLMALFLRGGVLVLLIGTLGVPPQVAILGAILAATLVTRRARQLCARPCDRGSAEGGSWQAIAFALGLYGLLLRVVYLASLELFPEEAYYWNYSQHLDIGYLDHPPMVAWLIRCGTALFGNSPLGVRIGSVLCAAVASFFAYRLTRELFGRPSARIALVLMQLLPAFLLSGLLMTPDAPLTAAWAATLYYLQRALIGGSGRAWWGVGIALGLGLISKYTIGLLVPATLLFVLIDAPSRRWLWHVLPYGAALVAAVIFSPVFIWNAQHDWASFAFQTSHRLTEVPRFSLHKLIGSAFILLSPTGFLALPFVLRNADAGRAAGAAEARVRRFTCTFTLVPLAVFVLFSLSHAIKFDWTIALWLAAVPALAQAITSAPQRLPGWLRRSWGATAVALVLVYGAALHYLTLGPPGLPYSRQMLTLPVAWEDLGSQVDALAARIRTSSGHVPLVVGMNRYMVASELAFYASNPARAAQDTTSQNLFGLSGLMYEQWFPNKLQQGRTLLLVALDASELSEARLAPHVGALGQINSGVLRRNGRAVGEYFYRVAEDYRNESE